MTSGRPVRCTSTPLRLATRLHRSPPARAGLSLSRTGRGARGELAASTSRASGFPSVPSVARRISSRLADYSMAVAACWEESSWLNPLAIRPARRLVWWSGPRSRCDPVAAGMCRAAWPSSFGGCGPRAPQDGGRGPHAPRAGGGRLGVVAHKPRYAGVVAHVPDVRDRHSVDEVWQSRRRRERRVAADGR